MQNKYADSVLYNSFNKLSRSYIKSIQSKIKDYLKSINNVASMVFFCDKKKIEKEQGWYNGYSISKDSIGIMVYFFDRSYEELEAYNLNDFKFKECLNKIISIIKSEKIPFNFSVEYDIHSKESPIELTIKISDLEKIDKNLGKSSTNIIYKIVKDNYIDIKNGLRKITNKYKDGYLGVFDSPDIHGDNVEIRVYLMYNSSLHRPMPSSIDMLTPSITRLMKKYIPFNFTVLNDGRNIYLSIKTIDIYLENGFMTNKSYSIFSSVAFI